VKGDKWWPEVSLAAHASTSTSVAAAAAGARIFLSFLPSFQACQNRTRLPISEQQLVENYYINAHKQHIIIRTPSRLAATKLWCTICSSKKKRCHKRLEEGTKPKNIMSEVKKKTAQISSQSKILLHTSKLFHCDAS
jgi:hypothetical protein